MQGPLGNLSQNKDQFIEKYDLIISGGGMIGATLALAAANAGATAAVIEPQTPATQDEGRFDGRVSAIALTSKRMLAHLGVWQHVQDEAEPILDIRVSDGNSPFFLHYDHLEVGEEPFGWIVENRALRRALNLCIDECATIHTRSPAMLRGFSAHAAGVEVQLDNSETLHGRLLIGADGKNSAVRRLSGIESVEAAYHHSAIVCTIAHEKPHRGLAQERFLPQGPFAVLPMTRNRSSLVWTEANEHIAMYLGLPDAELVQEITERVGGYLGAISLAGPRFAYPLSFHHAKSYTAPRIALIGDAAHVIHPIAGQGVNLGFRDVAVLAELIGRRIELGLDIADSETLAAYERWRRFDNAAMLAVTDGLTRIFSNQAVPLAIARRAGLWGVSKMPPLKRFFMRHAMGLTGDIPALMRG